MLMVCVEQAWVEAELVGGRLGCPSCRGVLGPWGGMLGSGCCAARWGIGGCGRVERAAGSALGRMCFCRMCLVRRRDEVSVIGGAIEANIAGEGYRPIAERLGVPKDTVRGWLRRFIGRADQVRAHFTRWAGALDPELGRVLPAGGASRTRLKRSRSPSGRGCCASGQARCGALWGAVGRAAVVQHELPLPAGAMS